MIDDTNLFDAFGGTRKMAGHLGCPSSTVNSWKAAGRIPAAVQPSVLEKAQEAEIDVTAEDVIFPLRARRRAFGAGANVEHAEADTSQVQRASCGTETKISAGAEFQGERM